MSCLGCWRGRLGVSYSRLVSSFRIQRRDILRFWLDTKTSFLMSVFMNGGRSAYQAIVPKTSKGRPVRQDGHGLRNPFPPST